MSKRTHLILMLLACSAIVGRVVVSAPWDVNKPPQRVVRLQEGRRPQAELPAPNEPSAAEEGEGTVSAASASPPDETVPGTQAEARALKRDAVGIASELVEVFPDDAVTYALLGAAHHNSGNSEKATRWLRKCLELDPDRADAYGMLALIASKKGDFERAATLCKEALKRNPTLRDVQLRLGHALMDLGETDELIRTMGRVVKMPPPSSEGYYLLGQGYLQSGDYLKAKESFQVVVGIRPDHTQAFFGLFTACTRLQQQNEADAFGKRFQELEAIDRNAATDRNVGEKTLSGLPMVRKTVAKTYTGAAQIYQIHGDLPKAEELWRKAADLDPHNTICRAGLMSLYVQQGRESDARELFEQLAKEQPKSGANHSKNQDLGGARVAMGRAVELDSDNADYRTFYERLQKEQ